MNYISLNIKAWLDCYAKSPTVQANTRSHQLHQGSQEIEYAKILNIMCD